MNKAPLFILLIVAVVVVSGCAAQQQADLVKVSFEKASALEKGAGYAADYTTAVSFSFSDSFKDYSTKNPTLAMTFKALGSLKANFKLTEAVGNAGNNKKVVMDMSEFIASISKASPSGASGLPANMIISSYKDGKDATVCMEADPSFWKSFGKAVNTSVCVKGDAKDLSKSGIIGNMFSQFSQYSSTTPSNSLEALATLYSKGLLNVGAMKDDSAAGRPCKSVAFSISDISKLSDADFTKLLSGSAPTGNSEGSFQKPVASLIKTLIKEVSEEFCFDNENGLPLKVKASVGMDMSVILKLGLQQAKALAQSEEQKTQVDSSINDIPSNLVMTTHVDLEATKFKTPSQSADLTAPTGAKAYSAEDFTSMFAPKATDEIVPTTGTGAQV